MSLAAHRLFDARFLVLHYFLLADNPGIGLSEDHNGINQE